MYFLFQLLKVTNAATIATSNRINQITTKTSQKMKKTATDKLVTIKTDNKFKIEQPACTAATVAVVVGRGWHFNFKFRKVLWLTKLYG